MKEAFLGDLIGGLEAIQTRRLSTARWYVASTLPKQEFIAAQNLANQGFEYFLPRMTVTKRHARKFITRLDPVFPGYIFITVDVATDRWRSINGTRGVGRLLMSGDLPTPVKAGVVETLRASTADDGSLTFVDPIRPGAEVRLVAGPFAQALSVVEKLDSRERVHLLLSLVGGRVRVQTALNNVVAAP